MQPLKTHDYLTLARQRLFDWVRPLTAEQYAREFPMGRISLGRTLTHILISEWYYVRRMQRLETPPYAQWPIQDENPPAFAELERAWAEQAAITRGAIAGMTDWDADIEYEITDDDNRRMIITASAADIYTQLVLHEVHHRAHAMNMLRQLGVAAQDLDFNALMYKRRPA